MAAYHQAGVKGRVVDELLIKLAIFDRKNTLLSIASSIIVTAPAR